MNPLIEVTDILDRLSKPIAPAVRAQLEWRIRELEAEYVAQVEAGRDHQEESAL